jgi:uncharacterized membrane protein YphA (DoxX/SURF4 family)
VSGAGYATAVLLAALFAWAGVAKLRDPQATETTFAALGLPAAATLAAAVPVAELVLAVLLLVSPRAGAVLAIGAMLAFTIVLVRAMRAGVEVGCGCFGSANREPVGAVALLRNGLMTAAAVLVALVAARRAPGLDDVILVTTGTAVSAVVLALADLGRRTGHVLRVDLAPGPEAGPG